MRGSYAPGHPDIGTAVHGTAFTGADLSIGIIVLVVVVVIGALLLAYAAHQRGRG